MEYRLFFIGIFMGAFAWRSHEWQKKGGPRNALESALWHALFFFIAAASITSVLAVSMETSMHVARIFGTPYSIGDLYPALAAGIFFGVVGFWRANSTGRSADKRRKVLSEDLEWSDTVFSAALMASLLMMFVLQAFKIPSASMENTLLIGDHLFVNKFLYGLRVPVSGKRLFQIRPPQKGDVMVFQFPSDNPEEKHCSSVQFGKDFIKRVIGVPGDVIEVRNGVLSINGAAQKSEPYAVYSDYYRETPASRASELTPKQYQDLWENHKLDMELEDHQRDYFGPVTVPPGAYFMMGDNRDRSCDSRYWGPVEQRYIKGKAWFLYWPPSRLGIVH